MIQVGAKTQAFKGLKQKKLCKVKRATTQGDYGLHRVKKVDPTGQVFSTFTTGSYPIYWSGSLNNSVFPPAYVTPKKNEENNKPHNRLPQHCNYIL